MATGDASNTRAVLRKTLKAPCEGPVLVRPRDNGIAFQDVERDQTRRDIEALATAIRGGNADTIHGAEKLLHAPARHILADVGVFFRQITDHQDALNRIALVLADMPDVPSMDTVYKPQTLVNAPPLLTPVTPDMALKWFTRELKPGIMPVYADIISFVSIINRHSEYSKLTVNNKYQDIWNKITLPSIKETAKSCDILLKLLPIIIESSSQSGPALASFEALLIAAQDARQWVGQPGTAGAQKGRGHALSAKNIGAISAISQQLYLIFRKCKRHPSIQSISGPFMRILMHAVGPNVEVGAIDSHFRRNPPSWIDS